MPDFAALRRLALLALAIAAPTAPAIAAPAETEAAEAYRTGDLLAATRHWTEAARLCRIAGDTSGETDALASRGEVYQTMGQLHDAAADLASALTRAQQAKDPARIAAISGAQGSLAFQARDLEQARTLLERSLDLARTTHLPAIAAASANNLGNVEAASGNPEEAEQAYTEAAAAAREAGDRALLATALINRARIGVSRGPGLLPLLDDAARATSALPDGHEKALDLIAIGHMAEPPRLAPHDALFKARTRIAYDSLQQGARLAATLHDPRASSLASGYLAELQELDANRDAAASVHRAIALAQQSGATDLLYRWEWINARLANAAGDRPTAIAAYRRSVAALETVRQDIPTEYVDGRSSYRETVGPIYFELADLLLREAAVPHRDEATVAALLVESRNTEEALKTVEVREFFRDPCLVGSTAGAARPNGDTAFGPRTALLYPIVLPDRIELLLTFPDQHQERVTSPVLQQDFTETVRAERTALESGAPNYLPQAARLYDWLIRPISETLASHQIQTLLIVPDGVLRTIPLAALYDGQHFLIETYAVGTLPSLALTDLRRAPPASRRVLLSGISKAVQGYPALPFVNRELGAVSSVSANATLLQDERFQLSSVEAALRTVRYRVVHIASHGEFGGDAAHTFILTYDSRLTLDNLEQDIKYSKFSEDPLDLLVLSACSTAAGDDRAALGLAGVAVKAGARSAVATLWSTNDEAAASLFPAFYRELATPGMTKARALQRAQLDLMQNPRFHHPGYWAPFLLIGNWM